MKEMTDPSHRKSVNAVFLTFAGNCRAALCYYQSCFGGRLQFETLEEKVCGDSDLPIVSGSLIAESIVIHGTDLVHDEGRILGNYMAIFIHCKSSSVRKELIQKLQVSKLDFSTRNYDDRLIEIIDLFEVRWVLYV